MPLAVHQNYQKHNQVITKNKKTKNSNSQRPMKKLLLLLPILISLHAYAQPQPGDIFREYTWFVPDGIGNEPYLRVCGDGYYQDQTRKGQDLFGDNFVKDGWFTLKNSLDLKDAIKAEIVVEKMLCHDTSTGLGVKFNDGAFRYFQEASGIPAPQDEYTHHFYPITSIPLSDLKAGSEANKFRFTLNKTQRWGMPQNVVYGMVLRVYYKYTKPHTEASLVNLKNGDVLGETHNLDINAKGSVAKVEYIGNYEDLNMEGDGLYKQWHHYYFRGNLKGNIGTTTNGTAYTWNTQWLPDQDPSMQIAARVTDNNGVIYFTKSVDKIGIKRPYKVELGKPYDIPRRWATREREFTTTIDLKGDPMKAEKFMVVCKTWSPGYMNGVYLNDFLLMDRESCKYCYHEIRKEFDHPEWLTKMNFIKTGLTPLVRGKMTHGTEIQYPGFMFLVKYKAE
jgi:hypothetical protein